MAATSSSVYAKGSLLGSDKDWYHGQLTRVEAEQALTASGCDCFLIRENRGALVLSLIHRGQVHHVNIIRGPGWYELESGSAQYSFTELEELVSYYSINAIKELTLRVPCKKTNTTDGTETQHYYDTLSQSSSKSTHFYNSISELSLGASHLYESIETTETVYSKGEPTDLLKYDWYHGNISREQAEVTLIKGRRNQFLVRGTAHELILSKAIQGWVSHDVIQQCQGGYNLEGKNEVFQTIQELILHYQQFPISDKDKQVLGMPADKKICAGKLLKHSENIFKKEEILWTLKWRRCADLPVGVSVPHVVRIGDHVYVGGGNRRGGDQVVYKYVISRDTWTSLPDCPTYHHGLVTLNGELIAIGGKLSHHNIITNIVHTFRDDRWQEVLPPMPTARSRPSAVSHANTLIISTGGIIGVKSNGERLMTDVVEIFSLGQWYNTKRLPFPASGSSLCIIGDVCYRQGGNTLTAKQSRSTLYTTVSSLQTPATPVSQTTWEVLPDKHPLSFSSLVELDGRLTAIGGAYKLPPGTKFISAYDFVTDTWVECKGAELPLPLYRAGTVKLASDEVMIVGGEEAVQDFSKHVAIFWKDETH